MEEFGIKSGDRDPFSEVDVKNKRLSERSEFLLFRLQTPMGG